MPLPLDQFVKQLEDSGILAGDTLQDFIPPKASPKDAEELARELVRKKKLTKFQAEEAYRGKAKSLVLGNYVLMEKIGAGGMGQVFKAEHRRMKRIVAVKVLPAKTMKDPATVARFEREVEVAAKINHPNIVTAYDADRANGVHFLVMELVEGSDLSALVKKNGPFLAAKAVNYILQAAKGLEAAHKKGVIHRDIKPANLLLDTEGTVKILDMGLARLNGDGDAATQAELTGTGTVMGTVDYMAPEQALSTKTADARADIYALGCSLYYLLTGQATYGGETLMAKMLAHREEPIPSLLTLPSGGSPGIAIPGRLEDLDAIFRKMVAKTVQDRYQTMSVVIAELERWGASPEQTVSIPSSQTSLSDTGLTDFLKELPTVQVKSAQTKAVKAPAAAASSKGDKKRLLLIGGGILGVLILLAGLVVKFTTKDGTLIVTVNEPDAEVEVLNEEGKVEITRKGEKSPITIKVVPGKHRLKVSKDGFEFFTQEFSLDANGEERITAKLVPLEEKPAIAGTKPATADGPKKPLAFTQPGFDQWVKKTAALPAAQQVEAVRKKLVELNPGFDGKLMNSFGTEKPDIENGIVTTLSLSTSQVTDISPIRAFQELKVLACRGDSKQKGGLTDLSPLTGMLLAHFECGDSELADLSALKGMSLKTLDCSGTQVSDLSPLRGMPLVHFKCSNTLVSDLSPLKESPIIHLAIYGTLVADLSPINAIPLSHIRLDFKPFRDTDLLRSIKTLDLINDKSIAEFWKEAEAQQAAFEQWTKDVAAMPAALQVEAVSKKLVELNPGFDGDIPTKIVRNGMVTDLGFWAEHITDISPVRALTGLQTLFCNKGRLADISPLKGLSLTQLHVDRTKISDLSPLRGMKLIHLDCASTAVADLSPLRDMPLQKLIFNGTRVTDLSPLKGMQTLTHLNCFNSGVSDLTPLKGLQLTFLGCNGTKVTDWRPIRSMPLETLWGDFHVSRDEELLHSFKTLQIINGRPAADFWKDVEGKKKPLAFTQPGFDQWVKKTAALPAEEQVAAVSKKLVELNPGFDGKVTPTIQDGVVTGLEFLTDNVTDISPVRALSGLLRLTVSGRLSGEGYSSELADVTPLKGMSLTALRIIGTNVSDLSPLNGMPLTVLDCGYTKVADLTALNGMPMNNLFINSTQVSELSLLSGMPLRHFNCANTKVADLSPLKGRELTTLEIQRTLVSDLSPLKDMPLKYLVYYAFKPFRDTELLRSIKTLETINDKPAAEFWKEAEAQQAAFEQWTKDVAAMPADKQVAAVSKKLVELNPGFDGKINGYVEQDVPNIQNGVVTEIGFLTDKVTDISPVRALKRLRALRCGGPEGESRFGGKLVDLSPLKGMSLTRVNCIANWELNDISPLSEMPVEYLILNWTSVSDFSALRRMPLKGLFIGGMRLSDLSPIEALDIGQLDISFSKEISDLTPLTNLRLGAIALSDTSVSDLSPLKNHPLNYLACRNTQVSDFSLLKGMPLKTLDFDFKPFRDTELLRSIKTLETINGKPTAEFWKEAEAQQTAFEQWAKDVAAMPADKQVAAVGKKLVELNPGFDGKVTSQVENGVVVGLKIVHDDVTDISPVRALTALRGLNCEGQAAGRGKLSDLAPLQGLSLDRLNITYTNVSDLSPLKGMRLTKFYAGETQVGDLSPLNGMPLTVLSCDHTKISDLTPLRGMPLTSLNCHSNPIVDLSPLKGAPLSALNISRTEVVDLSPLKGLALTSLGLGHTSVADLTPLQGMPLTEFDCNDASVTDLSPLAGMKLTGFWFNPRKITKGIEVIREMQSLMKIGVRWDGEQFSPVDFWKKYDAGEFGKPVTDINNPAFQKWVKDVQALPADKQVEAVSKKLVELNPGFDGKVTPDIEGGVVTHFTFLTDHVTDISPVRALAELTHLTCGGGKPNGNLANLSPLKGMTLRLLWCPSTSVADLSPLSGMPLVNLNCSDTLVSDLAPLKGMALTGLSCYRTYITDLDPVRELPLNFINIGLTQITDLSPLQGMTLKGLVFDFRPQRDTEFVRSMTTLMEINGQPAMEFWKDVAEASDPSQTLKDPAFQQWLKHVSTLAAEEQVEAVSKKLQDLNPSFDGKVQHKIDNGVVVELKFVSDKVWNIAPVRALVGLKSFDCSSSLLNAGLGKIADLSPLTGMKLNEFRCVGTSVFDLSPLRGMPLHTLTYATGPAFDFTPLQGMPLKKLDVSLTPLSDLTQVKGLPLTHLVINGTHVRDLAALREMPLLSLHIRVTRISDLSPLAGMRLIELGCEDTNVSDLSPIKGQPLQVLFCDFKLERDTKLLRSIKTLEHINGKPAAEFWKDVEERQAEKK